MANWSSDQQQQNNRTLVELDQHQHQEHHMPAFNVSIYHGRMYQGQWIVTISAAELERDRAAGDEHQTIKARAVELAEIPAPKRRNTYRFEVYQMALQQIITYRYNSISIVFEPVDDRPGFAYNMVMYRDESAYQRPQCIAQQLLTSDEQPSEERAIAFYIKHLRPAQYNGRYVDRDAYFAERSTSTSIRSI